MRQQTTEAIVLRRINYGEADKIITFITPDYGKIRVIAKGVRKSASKLAGGIELFSESNIAFIKGRGEIDTLVSSQLKTNYGGISKSLPRSQSGYFIINSLDQATEDKCEQEYYSLLARAFYNLQEVNDEGLSTRVWFLLQLLQLTGHAPELREDNQKQNLLPNESYNFDFQSGRFEKDPRGGFKADHIKLIRLLKNNEPQKLQQIQGVEQVLNEINQLAQRMGEYYLHLKTK